MTTALGVYGYDEVDQMALLSLQCPYSFLYE